MTTKNKNQLSPTMQIAVTASLLDQAAKTADAEQMNTDKLERVRKSPLPGYLAAVLK